MSQVRLKQLDSKIRYENKRVVESLVARLCAEWVIRGVIAQMLPAAPGLQRLQHYAPKTEIDGIGTYLGQGFGKLPSEELPLLKFKLRGKLVWGGSFTRKWLQEGMQ